eukprot:TRINITY_DN2576_c5_g1_i1.p1 TRINITY_DN2576_c5_g1~~TRINITY_DN2576_c5_g1_i1.p1  ORF type:complete len:585 (+),score=78.80 TRINITY_DN2576_c5_g1_i1:63-1757(+)
MSPSSETRSIEEIVAKIKEEGNEYLPVKKWPKGYLEADGMGRIGSDISKGAPGVLGAMSNGGGKTAIKVTLDTLTEKAKDQYRLALDALLGDVTPWYPNNTGYEMDFLTDEHAKYIMITVPQAPTSQTYTLDNISWAWVDKHLKPTLTKENEPTPHNSFLSHLYATELDKHKIDVTSPPITLKVYGFKMGMNGWLDGLPTHYYLSTADGGHDQYSAVLVFTTPSSSFRRMARKAKKVASRTVDAPGVGKNLFHTITSDEDWSVLVRPGGIGGKAAASPSHSSNPQIFFKPNSSFELYNLVVLDHVSTGKPVTTNMLLEVLKSHRENLPVLEEQTGSLEAFKQSLLSVKTPKIDRSTEAPADPILPDLLWKDSRAIVEEGPRVEFKTDVYPQTFESTVRKTITSMLNTGRGGVILYGITDEGRVTGVPLTPTEREVLVSIVKSVVNGIRPIPPEPLLKTTFHSLENSSSTSASWWSSSVTSKPSSNKCVLSISIGRTTRWPFHLCGPKSGIARIRRFASSDVMSEGEMTGRLVLWEETVGNNTIAGQDNSNNRSKRRKKKSSVKK